MALPRDPITAVYLESLPEGFTAEEGLLRQGSLVYVPEDTEIELRILERYHDRKAARDLGQEKTFYLVTREYIWPGICTFVNRYT